MGDIDRGGVFAQLYGTIALLDADERARVKGMVVNKFRGDRAILEPGLKTLEELCGVPVAGVVPYLHVDIDDEDSLTERFYRPAAKGLIDVAVIRLPYISNFTDFAPFERQMSVSLRYAERGELGRPDMIILPGTKSTIADLIWLRESGLEAESCRRPIPARWCSASAVPDSGTTSPSGWFGTTKSAAWASLMDTVFRGERCKRRRRACSACARCSRPFPAWPTSYEIHMGAAESDGAHGRGQCLRQLYPRGFDAPNLRRLSGRCAAKGIDYNALEDGSAAYKERQYDLADAVRAGLT